MSRKFCLILDFWRTLGVLQIHFIVASADLAFYFLVMYRVREAHRRPDSRGTGSDEWRQARLLGRPGRVFGHGVQCTAHHLSRLALRPAPHRAHAIGIGTAGWPLAPIAA